MATVFDVAEYILTKTGTISTMKLQKLVYYSQAWNLAWNEKPIFKEEIEAWANGPVVRALYDVHRGEYEVSPGTVGGDPEKLNRGQKHTINSVIKYYGKKTPQWLSDLTHSEQPWKRARKGIADGERGSKIISKEWMLNYYSSLKDE